MTPDQERRFRRLIHDQKAAGEGGTANDRGDFTWDELDALVTGADHELTRLLGGDFTWDELDALANEFMAEE